MKAGGILCRSQAATAVCVPRDARSMVATRRADPTVVAEDARSMVAARRADPTVVAEDARDVRYARLGDQPRLSLSRRFTLTSRGAAPPPPPTSKPSRRRVRVPVAVTLPMVTKNPVRETRGIAKRAPTTAVTAPAASSAAVAPQGDQVLQVVVMKVAIHCQGCAGKVRKHISKMEGVTSFSIDLESKKVTVTGHVSPACVLESISKVKKAELLVV